MMINAIAIHKRTAGRRPKTDRPEDDTRAAILSAARRLFAQRGFEGASMREVAAAARVNNAMIYYHFKDKDDLYRSVIFDSVAGLNSIWDEPLFRSSAPVKQKIRRYIEEFIRYEQKSDDIRRIMAMEFAKSGNISCICEDFFGDNQRRLIKLLEDGIKSGELKKIEPSMGAAALVGIIVHNFIMLPMAEHVKGKKVSLSPEKFGAFASELFFNGLEKKA
jgi:TetR/AcrR family transcriptional regulator